MRSDSSGSHGLTLFKLAIAVANVLTSTTTSSRTISTLGLEMGTLVGTTGLRLELWTRPAQYRSS